MTIARRYSAENRPVRRRLAGVRRARVRAVGRRAVPEMGRDFPGESARQGHLRRDLHPRDGQPEAGRERVLGYPQPAGVQPAALAIHQPPRLGLAHPVRSGARQGNRPAARAHREGLRRRARRDPRALGHRVDLRRSAGEAEPLAAGVSLARGARLGRAAPARLLGNRADQCAAHRRKRLGHPEGHGRLMGRRDGPYPMDAGGLAQCRPRL